MIAYITNVLTIFCIKAVVVFAALSFVLTFGIVWLFAQKVNNFKLLDLFLFVISEQIIIIRQNLDVCSGERGHFRVIIIDDCCVALVDLLNWGLLLIQVGQNRD